MQFPVLVFKQYSVLPTGEALEVVGILHPVVDVLERPVVIFRDALIGLVSLPTN